jgi:hypothetical protein
MDKVIFSISHSVLFISNKIIILPQTLLIKPDKIHMKVISPQYIFKKFQIGL